MAYPQLTPTALSCFRDGLRIIARPGLRAFVMLPIAINALLFSLMIWWAISSFRPLLDHLMSSLPGWLSFLDYLLWPLFVLLLLVVMFFTFTLVANLIASPFNGVLAEKVEAVARGTQDEAPFKLGELLASVPRSVARELNKMAYTLPRMLGLLVLTLIPVVNLVAAPLWLLFSIWSMALQYVDYPADNNRVTFKDMLAWLRKRRLRSLSFGAVIYVALLVPFLNLLLMPAAIAAATLFWVREEQRLPTV